MQINILYAEVSSSRLLFIKYSFCTDICLLQHVGSKICLLLFKMLFPDFTPPIIINRALYLQKFRFCINVWFLKECKKYIA